MANYSDIRYVATGVTEYATVDSLPTSGNSTGDQALVTGTNRLYIWNGSGWYNIALINTTPSISGVSSAYTLETDGTATTVTITATDPEGIPITYSIASDTSGSIATVSQGTGSNTNVFTITPSTTTANAGTFSLTFRASDGVNIATAVSEFTLEFIVANSKYTTALITSVGANNAVNNSFDDASTNDHTVTANGNVTQNTFSPYRHGGYSTYFDGSGDYITYTDASLAEGTDDFTVEFWIRRIGTQAQNDAPLSHGTTPGWQVCFNTSNNLVFMKDGSDRDLSTDTLTEGQWYHVVYQRDSGTVQGFLDGVSLGTITVTNDFTNTTIEVGVNRGGTAYYSGNLRDVRIIKGTALYSSSGFTPPTEPLEAVSGTGYSTTLLTCHLPYIADGGANSLTPTVNGDTKVEALTPFDSSRYTPSIHGGSIYFNGSGDYLQVPQAAAARGTGDYTIECWVYSKTFANEKFIFDARSAASAIDDFMTINSSGYLFFRSNGTTTTTTQQMSLNTWHHFAQVRNGSTLKVYVDGVEVASKTQSGNLSIASAFDIGGSSNDGASATIDGYISDFRIVLGTAVYTSAFTPPTAPLTAITNTSLLLSGTNAGIIDKSQSVKELTLNGDVKSSTTQTKYLTSSMYFDGTGDYLELSRGQDLDIFNLGTSDFTVEMWLFPTDLSNSGTIISFIRANNTSDDNHPHIYRAASELRFYTDGTDKISGGTLSLSTWHHVAISRSGNDHKMFLDGSQVGSTYTASNTYTQGRPVVASYNDTLTTVGSANLFTGYISDVRITSGLARYTSNFTPPTAALGG